MAIYKNSSTKTTDFKATANGYTEDSKINSSIDDIFSNTKDFKDVTSYKLMRGVPDFGSLVQFNPYETGYAAFIICDLPVFIKALAKHNSSYNKLIQNWAHIIEYEFKSFDGLDDITGETMQLGDDLNSINVINKVNMQSASDFTLTYDEKSGSPLTKFAKLYLTGIKDPRTQVKTYHGLIMKGIVEPGFENEVFTFLFIATDSTMLNVEYATLLIGCQLNSCETSMYNYTKGDINKKEVSVKFSGYPITSKQIDWVAQDMLSYLITDGISNKGTGSDAARQIWVNSNNFTYTGTDKAGKLLSKWAPNGKTPGEKDLKSIDNISNSTYSYKANNYYNFDLASAKSQP